MPQIVIDVVILFKCFIGFSPNSKYHLINIIIHVFLKRTLKLRKV